MVRFILACVFYTTVARWGFAEITTMFPDAAPYLNEAAHKFQIPTHQNWPTREQIGGYIDNISAKVDDAAETIEAIKVAIKERRTVAEYQG